MSDVTDGLTTPTGAANPALGTEADPHPDAAPVRRRSRLRRAAKDTHGLEFVLGMLLIAEGIGTPGLTFPFSLVGLALLIVYGLSRRPVRTFGPTGWVPWLLACVMIYLAFLSSTTPATQYASDWLKRWVRMCAVVITAVLVATERIHVASVLRGLTVALLLNIPAYYLHLTPDFYPGSLTGFLGDKNKAGMFYAVSGVLLLWQARERFSRVVMTLVFAVPVYLTGSRTSLVAYFLGVAWTWVAARRPMPVRWALALGAYFLVNFVEANFSQVGQYADRVGSDLLRARIGVAVAEKVAASPPQGVGLGEAYVFMDGEVWFFHDAFATLRVEGGYFTLAAIVLVTVWIGLRPFKNYRPAYQGMVTQGATLTILLCGTKLGEVFLTIPWALVLGVGLNYILKGEPQSERAGADVDGFMRTPDPGSPDAEPGP